MKSKTCKAAGSQEECGVWLDAAGFKANKRRKLTRPISKLLNPLARSGGYSMAVALNFTQTKMEMPVTKQSRISSFFAPQSKKGTDAEDCSSSWPLGRSSTPRPGACSGTKRKREMIFKLPSELNDVSGCSSLMEPQEYDAAIARVSGEIYKKADDDDDDGKAQQFLRLIWGYQSEECEPAGKKLCENIQTKTVTDTQADTKKAIKGDDGHESLLHSDLAQQHTHENFRMNRNMCGENSGSSASLSTEDLYTQKPIKDQRVKEKRASFLTPRSATELQNTTNYPVKPYKEPELFEQRCQRSPAETEDKENRRPTSPRPSIALSPFKQHVYFSPAKCASNFNRRLCQTPKKSIREAQENDEDSFGMLFTQDTEGFRVIAHRSKQTRCQLKDQTNSFEGREYSSPPFVMPVNTEENSNPDLEMLFTQDSQGNIVIKH